jgi:hypothetical protein
MSLNLESVSPGLVKLLGQLMEDRHFDPFALGGGTSLALRFGHRVSIDIDLFSDSSFDAGSLAQHLRARYGILEVTTAVNTVRGIVDGIKVDILAHRYPLLGPIEVIESIRMLSLKDLCAMKLNAIANRGSKKDFWDFAELFSHFPKEEMLAFFAEKYPQDSLWNVGKSLGYFDDAEIEPDPRDLRGRTWEQVKKIIETHNRL